MSAPGVLPVRRVLALLSGLPAQPVMNGLSGWSPLLLGAAVLVPFIQKRQARPVRVPGMTAGAALIHWVSFLLTVFMELKLSAIAVQAIPGLAGALLAALLVARVGPFPDEHSAATLAALAGLAGGAVSGITPPSRLWGWGDYTVWQVLVFPGLCFGSAAGRNTAAPT
jgi:hypothetical protein